MKESMLKMSFDIYQLDGFEEYDEQVELAVEKYQDDLIERFFQAPEGRARLQADPDSGFWAARLIDYGYTYTGTTVPHMTVADLIELLTEVFPRKISLFSPDDTDGALPELIAFWEYLKREYTLPNAETILRYLRKVNPADFKEWMNDPARFGMAKSFMTMGQTAGFDMTDQRDSQAFIDLYNANLRTHRESLDPFGSWGEERSKIKPDPKKKRSRKITKASRKKNRKRK